MKDLFIDVLTGEITETDTPIESIQYWKQYEETQTAKQEQINIARKAVLERLGITEEEAKLLLS